MTRKPGFYWAYDDEDRTGQPVEILENGKVLVLGVSGLLPENHFVHIGDPIAPPSPEKSLIDWLNESPRRPANQAFTAGELRQVAYMIENEFLRLQTVVEAARNLKIWIQHHSETAHSPYAHELCQAVDDFDLKKKPAGEPETAYRFDER